MMQQSFDVLPSLIIREKLLLFAISSVHDLIKTARSLGAESGRN
jgi:hypothetical protein